MLLLGAVIFTEGSDVVQQKIRTFWNPFETEPKPTENAERSPWERQEAHGSQKTGNRAMGTQQGT